MWGGGPHLISQRPQGQKQISQTGSNASTLQHQLLPEFAACCPPAVRLARPTHRDKSLKSVPLNNVHVCKNYWDYFLWRILTSVASDIMDTFNLSCTFSDLNMIFQ
jgi:hypothetical protein